MITIKPFKFETLLKAKWECPNCTHINLEECSIDPYRILAEDPPDVECEQCKEFYTLSFYDD